MVKNIKTSIYHEQFMKLAIQKAQAGIKKGQTPFGACIVKDDKVIACAHNTVWQSTNITAHAEINAIAVACKKLKTIDLSDCVIYSTCEPCPMCFSACHWAKIKTIVFGASIEDAKKAGFNELCIPAMTMKKKGKSSILLIDSCLTNENYQLFNEWKHCYNPAY
jgi:guanine deaminase